MKILVKVKGGPHSGNYGHAGIPGSVGGSAPTSYRIVSGKEFEEYIESWDKTEDYKAGLNSYSGDGYSYLNEKLRNGEEIWDEDGSYAWGMYWDVKRGVDSSTVPEDITVFRGFTKNPFENASPGDVVFDKAFLSTSISKNTALGFTSRDSNGERHVAVITVPKGTHAAPLSHATDSEGNVRFEGELIFSDRKKMLYKGSHKEIIEGQEIVVHELEMPRPPTLQSIARDYGDAGQAAIGRMAGTVDSNDFVSRGGRIPLFEFNKAYEIWQSENEFTPVLHFNYPNPYKK